MVANHLGTLEIKKDQACLVFFYLVPEAGIEPARLFKPRDFKSLTSTYFVTRATTLDPQEIQILISFRSKISLKIRSLFCNEVVILHRLKTNLKKIDFVTKNWRLNRYC